MPHCRKYKSSGNHFVKALSSACRQFLSISDQTEAATSGWGQDKYQGQRPAGMGSQWTAGITWEWEGRGTELSIRKKSKMQCLRKCCLCFSLLYELLPACTVLLQPLPSEALIRNQMDSKSTLRLCTSVCPGYISLGLARFKLL